MRNDIYLKEMGKKIKFIRELNKITLRMLGELCGLDYSNISRLEGGQKDCHILTLKSIADVLKVDVKDLI